VSVAIGNADGDDYNDLAVGADGYDVSTGRAYVYHGTSGGIGTTASQTLNGEASGDSFGITVVLGNFNGDAYYDLAVGAKGNSSSTGRVYVYHGASGGVESSLSQALDGESSNHYFGDVLSANDSNLDGYDDLVVSATNYDETYSNRGKVYLYTGSSTGIPTASEQTWIGDYTENMEYFGHSTDF
jgi:ribosomal protein L35AE/L33A